MRKSISVIIFTIQLEVPKHADINCINLFSRLKINGFSLDTAVKDHNADLLAEKYHCLYNSVLTHESEFHRINSIIRKHITNVDVDITPHIIESVQKDLKCDKDGENHGFKSDLTDLIVSKYMCIYIFDLEQCFFSRLHHI